MTERMQRIDSPHSRRNRLVRFVWGIVYALLFRPSPRPLHRWRNRLLRTFGATLHPTARVVMERHACIADDVDVYCVEPVTIGACATVSQYSYLCGATHDFEQVEHPLVPGPIRIGRRCWLAADVFVAPGVTIGEGTVVGARSSVFEDLPPWKVAVGTPAKPVRDRGLGPEDFTGPE